MINAKFEDCNNESSDKTRDDIKDFVARSKRSSLSGMRVATARLIITSTIEGDGTKNNPNRYVDRCWDLDGNLLFENDPVKFKGSPLKSFWLSGNLG